MPKKVNYEEKAITLKEAIEALKDKSIEPVKKNKLLKTIVKKIEYSAEAEQKKIGETTFSLDIFLRL